MQIAVLGLGRFGYQVAMALFHKGVEVIAVDLNRDKVDRIKDHVSTAAIADCTDELALRNLGIHEADVAIVATGDSMEAGILATAVLRKLGVPRILSRAVTRTQKQILHEVGAHEVLFIEEQMGDQIASRLVAPHLVESMPLSSGHSLVELIPDFSFIGKTLKELNVRARFGVNVVAIKRKVPHVTESCENTVKTVLNDLPSPDEKITEEDILVVVGSDDRIARFAKAIEKEGEA